MNFDRSRDLEKIYAISKSNGVNEEPATDALMDHGEFDFFLFFRMTLFVFLTIYTALMLLSGIRRLIALLGGEEPQKDLLRLYVSYHLLTIQLAPIRGELIQIACWLAVLLLVWRLHALIA